jgi:hypothetical protein
LIAAPLIAWLSGCGVCWFFLSPQQQSKTDACTDGTGPYVEPPPPPADLDLHDLTCPGNLPVTASSAPLNNADLHVCFTETDAYGNTYWVDAPPDVVAYCSATATTGLCTVYFDDPCTTVAGQALWCVDDLTCASVGSGWTEGPPGVWTDPSGMCVQDATACAAARSAQAAALEAELDATQRCSIDFTVALNAPVAPEGGESSCFQSEGCSLDPAARVWVPGSDRIVLLNSTTSWVKLTTPYGVKTVPLYGSVALDDISAGWRYIKAGHVWAADTTWNGVPFLDPEAWSLPTTPILYTKSGSTVTLTAANQGSKVYVRVLQGPFAGPGDGWWGGPNARLTQTGTGTGTLTSTSLVYNQSQVWDGPASWNTTVQIHLEGSVTAHAP